MEYTASRVVVDTDILVDFMRGKNQAVAKIRELVEVGTTLATTVINVFELAYGAHRIGRARDVEDLVEALVVLNLSSREAVKAGEEAAYLASIGQMIDIRDLLIGVIARENGYAVLTGNIKHFSRIKGLKIVNYR